MLIELWVHESMHSIHVKILQFCAQMSLNLYQIVQFEPQEACKPFKFGGTYLKLHFSNNSLKFGSLFAHFCIIQCKYNGSIFILNK